MRLIKSDWNPDNMDYKEYIQSLNAKTPLEKVLLKIDKKRAVDIMVKYFQGEDNAFFGKTDDVLQDITKLIAGTGVEKPEEVVDSMFEDWEKDNFLSMPYLFIEMNDEGIDNIEAYYYDDIEEILHDIDDYLNAPSILDELQ